MELSTHLSIIHRFDNYYSGINNKSAFIITFNSIIVSGLFIGIPELQEMIVCKDLTIIHITLGAIMLLSLASVLLTISAIIPFLKSNNDSMWFFNDIAQKSIAEFKSQIEKSNEDSVKQDMLNQIHYLAIGLRKKHLKVRIALILNFIQTILIGLFTLIILTP